MHKPYTKKIIVTGLAAILACTAIYSLLYRGKSVPTLNNLEGKTVVIDPGHGGNDPGCRVNDKIWEKDITLAVARETARLLELAGAQVILTRNGDYAPGSKWLFFHKNNNHDDLDARLATVGKNNADIFISLHINSSVQKNRAGAVAYSGVENDPGHRLAQNIQQQLRQIPDMVKKTSHARDYYLLNRLEIPAAVIELGYISNQKDKHNLITTNYQKKLAEAISRGIVNYCNNPHDSGLAVHNPDTDAQKTVNNPNETVNSSATESVLTALEQLIEGSGRAEDPGPCIPGDITLGGVKISGTGAAVDLKIPNKESVFTGSEEEWTTISSIAYTLFELPQINRIQVTVNGKKRKTLAGHMDISKPLSREKLPLTKVAGGIMEGRQAKVAIVIDDFGQSNPEGVKEMLSIDRPLTFAVMPNLDNSRQHAVQAAKGGYEVIVHLPMQPVRGKAGWLGPGAITSDMTVQEIREQARRNFARIPYAGGFNNHMGSLITAREELVRPVLEAAADMGFYVLDSKTSNNSKIIPLAKSMGIAYTRRDVFLDDIKSTSFIKKQLDLLADIALTNGSAVGIGHVGMGGEKTARAIKEMIPEMEAKGVEFVYLNELMH